jgi:hypothetical protein
MTKQTSRAARATEIVPSVIAKKTKTPLLIHSPRHFVMQLLDRAQFYDSFVMD